MKGLIITIALLPIAWLAFEKTDELVLAFDALVQLIPDWFIVVVLFLVIPVIVVLKVLDMVRGR